MANEPAPESTACATLRATQVYVMAIVCLALGLVIGYLFRHAQSAEAAPQIAVRAAASTTAGAAVGAGHAPSLEEMRKLADTQAAPLLEKLKSDPKDNALLVQVAGIYHSSHQFKEAATYYDQAVQADPKNVELRTKLASSLYRSGDVDGAIAQLNRALSYDPKDANSLFNLGMIRLQGKGDGKGALAAWQRLLKANPQMSADRKAEVQKLMADVLTSLSEQGASKGGQSREGR